MCMLQPHKILAGICLAALVTACEDPDDFSPIPQITNVELLTDEFPRLEVDFRDGDGNLGLSENETEPPFDFVGDSNAVVSENLFYYNLYVDVYYFANGEWTLFEPAIPFYYRIPNITPTGQNKALEGTIEVDLTGNYPITFPEPADSIAFDASLVDRDLQLSNVLRSGAYPL